jgi:hypothetical protein
VGGCLRFTLTHRILYDAPAGRMRREIARLAPGDRQAFGVSLWRKLLRLRQSRFADAVASAVSAAAIPRAALHDAPRHARAACTRTRSAHHRHAAQNAERSCDTLTLRAQLRPLGGSVTSLVARTAANHQKAR